MGGTGLEQATRSAIPLLTMSTQTELRLLVTAAEAARLLGCSVPTVKRLADKGDLRIVRFGPGGHVRFRLREVEEFVDRQEEDD